jgi:hypothetical protein
MAKTNKDNSSPDNPHRTSDVVDFHAVLKRRKISVESYLRSNRITSEEKLKAISDSLSVTTNYRISEAFLEEAKVFFESLKKVSPEKEALPVLSSESDNTISKSNAKPQKNQKNHSSGSNKKTN